MEVLVIYLDEDNKKSQVWVDKEQLKYSENLVEFTTQAGNKFIIPTSRLLKIKERSGQ